MLKNLKIFISIITLVVIMGSSVTVFADENKSKTASPQFAEQDGTVIVQKAGKPISINLKATDTDSEIFYTTKKGDTEVSEEKKYVSPILLNGYNPLTIIAVARKTGFEDSDAISKTYVLARTKPKLRNIAYKKLKKGKKKITGSIKGINSLKGRKIRVAIKLSVKPSKGKKKNYRKTINVKNKRSKWTFKLNKPLKSKDKVVISAISKDSIISFKEESAISSIIVFNFTPYWKQVKKKIK